MANPRPRDRLARVQSALCTHLDAGTTVTCDQRRIALCIGAQPRVSSERGPQFVETGTTRRSPIPSTTWSA